METNDSLDTLDAWTKSFLRKRGSPAGMTRVHREDAYSGTVEERIGAWRRARVWVQANPFLVDLAGTIPLLLITLGLTFVGGFGNSAPVVPLLTIGFIAPLAIRRTRPVLSVVLIYSTGLLTLLLGVWELSPAALTVPIALYSVTLHGPRWAYLTALFGGLVGMTWLVFGPLWAIDRPGMTPGDIIGATFAVFFAFMFLLTVWAIALMRRSRRETITALIDRAARLEVERDQQHQIATAAERTRIAREMHDIVAHSLSVIIAQADGGRYVADQDQAAAERVLGTIAETGRDALSDMRRLLGVLRPDVGPTSDPSSPSPPGSSPTGPSEAGSPWRAQAPSAPNPHGLGASAASASEQAAPGVERSPQPVSGDLDVLINQVRASGMRVSLVRVGEPRALPPGMGLAVFRVSQEALTNVLKHAGPDPTVTMILRWAQDRLHLEVTDDGRGAAADSDGAGQGLVGMGERATMFGGALSTEPRPGGGFRVALDLPLPSAGGAPLAPGLTGGHGRAPSVTTAVPHPSTMAADAASSHPLDPNPARGSKL